MHRNKFGFLSKFWVTYGMVVLMGDVVEKLQVLQRIEPFLDFIKQEFRILCLSQRMPGSPSRPQEPAEVVSLEK